MYTDSFLNMVSATTVPQRESLSLLNVYGIIFQAKLEGQSGMIASPTAVKILSCLELVRTKKNEDNDVPKRARGAEVQVFTRECDSTDEQKKTSILFLFEFRSCSYFTSEMKQMVISDVPSQVLYKSSLWFGYGLTFVLRPPKDLVAGVSQAENIICQVLNCLSACRYGSIRWVHSVAIGSVSTPCNGRTSSSGPEARETTRRGGPCALYQESVMRVASVQEAMCSSSTAGLYRENH